MTAALVLRVIGAVLSFIYTAAIARQLGVHDAGQYFLVLSAAMFLSTLARAGLDNAVVRFASVAAEQENWTGLRHLFRSVVGTVTLLSSFVAFAVCILAGQISASIWGSRAMAPMLQIAAISIVSLGLMTILSEFLRAIGDLKASVLVSSIVHAATGVVLLTPLVHSFGPEGAALAFLMATLVSAGLATLWWRRRIGHHSATGQRLPLKPLIDSAKHLFLISVAGQAVMPYAPTMMIGVWGSEEQVAIFSVATRIGMIVALLLVATNIVVAPRFANLYDRQDFKGLEHAAKFSSISLTFAAAPIVVAGTVGSSFLMSIFGEEYRSGAAVLVVLLFGQLINVVSGSVGTLLMMTGHERELGTLTLVSAGALLALCLILVPLYGGIGAAAAAATATAILNLSALHIARRKLGIQASLIPSFGQLNR